MEEHICKYAYTMTMNLAWFDNDWDLSIFELMHESWAIPTVNMTYTRSQNYTNMMVGEHEI